MSPIPRNKRQSDLNTLAIPEELKADALAHVQRLDAENRLAMVDANYVRAFKNPSFAKAFMDTYAECVKAKGLCVPADIQRLLDDPALLSVIEEPYDE